MTFAVIGHFDTEIDLWRNFTVNKTVYLKKNGTFTDYVESEKFVLIPVVSS